MRTHDEIVSMTLKLFEMAIRSSSVEFVSKAQVALDTLSWIVKGKQHITIDGTKIYVEDTHETTAI